MKVVPWLIVGAASALSDANAADMEERWRPVRETVYIIHGGSLADRQAATAQDRKLTFHIKGKLAKEIFDSIGPDLPDTCSGEKGDRARDKNGIYCSYTARDKRAKEGPHRCWIGLDLRTGTSVGTVSC